jgi:hypothetical protein
MTTQSTEILKRGRLAKLGAFALHEFRMVLPPTIFFLVGFNLILFTKRLILAQHMIEFTGFFIATMGALVVGKVVLVADKIPYLRRFDYAPLARPILFKTLVYTVLVFVARLLESFVHYLIEGGSVGGGAFFQHWLDAFSWSQFIATQLWIFVLFLIYVTASELNALIGDGELFKIFFTRPSSELKATRRARIRSLVRLSQLADAHSIDVLRNAGTAEHAEVMAILQTLTQKGAARG